MMLDDGDLRVRDLEDLYEQRYRALCFHEFLFSSSVIEMVIIFMTGASAHHCSNST
jgi:hypothetical protein